MNTERISKLADDIVYQRLHIREMILKAQKSPIPELKQEMEKLFALTSDLDKELGIKIVPPIFE